MRQGRRVKPKDLIRSLEVAAASAALCSVGRPVPFAAEEGRSRSVLSCLGTRFFTVSDNRWATGFEGLKESVWAQVDPKRATSPRQR